MIHFDLEDRYEDELVVGSAISRREGLIYAVVVHVLLVAALIFGPRLHLFQPSPEQLEAQRQEQLQRQLDEARNRTFVFVAPKIDTPARTPPPRAELSDIDRKAQAPERAPQPQNPYEVADVGAARRIAADVDEGDGGLVLAGVRARPVRAVVGPVALVAAGRHVLGVGSPAPPMLFELVGQVAPGQIVVAVVADTLGRAGEERQVVGLRGVRHRVVVDGQAVVAGQAVEVGRGNVAEGRRWGT